jgi:predicted lipid-binding transport protein (Tim44 family)
MSTQEINTFMGGFAGGLVAGLMGSLFILTWIGRIK